MTKGTRLGDGASAELGGATSIVLLPAYLHFIGLTAVILAMSGATRHLDAIKVVVFLAAGSALFTIMVWLFGRGGTAGGGEVIGQAPSRTILAGLWGYGLALAISTLLSEFSWAGAHELLFYWAAVGFLLGGFWTGSNTRARMHIWVGLTVVLLLVNIFGYAQFNPRGTGHTVLASIYDALYGKEPPALQPKQWQAVLFTFKRTAHDRLMSTSFNQDFFAAQCLLYAPFAFALMLAKVRSPLRIIGGIAGVLSIISIWFCRSKGEYLAGGVEAVLFVGLILIYREEKADGEEASGKTFRRLAMGGGAAMLIALLGAMAMRLPRFSSQIISLGESFAARRIIYSGAFEIFKDFPWFGGGPGTFPIYFPRYRSPDYFENGISNVTNYTHNMILDLLSETGIVGAVMFAAILVPIAVGAVRALRTGTDRTTYLFLTASICGLVGIIGSNMTSVSWRWPIGASGLWSVLGMLAGVSAAILRGERDAERGRERLPLVRWMVFVATLAVFLCSVWRANTYWHSRKAYNEGLVRVEPNRAIVDAIARRQAKLPEDQYQALAREIVEGGLRLEEAIALDPVFISAYYKLGSAESLLAQIDGARAMEHMEASLAAYHELKALAPDYAEVHYNLGIINYQICRRKRARAKELDSRGDLAGGDLARSEAATYFDTAVEEFEIMAELSDREGVLTVLGERYVEAGRLSDGVGIYERAARLYPENEKVQLRLAELEKFSAKTQGELGRAEEKGEPEG